jgi:hypothetical protein
MAPPLLHSSSLDVECWTLDVERSSESTSRDPSANAPPSFDVRCSTFDVRCSSRPAILIPPGDPVALADAILLLVDNPELRAALGRGARPRAQAAFDIRIAAAGLARHYREVVDAGRATVPIGTAARSCTAPTRLRGR